MTKAPNAKGIYDMTGNVEEYVWDKVYLRWWLPLLRLPLWRQLGLCKESLVR